MNRYEKRSLISFMALYMGGVVLLFSLVSYWYYHKEQRRINHEQTIAIKLYDAQCEHLARLAPQGFICKIKRPETLLEFQTLYRELLIALIVTLLFSTLLSYVLARLSLRPMHEAYELMDGFVHAMIHDLNTPIAVAELNCNALFKSELTALQTRKLECVHKSMQRLLGLQKQLRSSMEKIHYDYRDRRFDLKKMLEDFEDYSELISLTCKDPVWIDADEMMVHRMLENLISNAMKYNQKSHPIIISFDQNELKIKDRGQGIENVNRIFEKYYRENSSMSGLGLGLGIVKMVSDHYKLDLKIESEKGVGTTVKLNFTSLLHTE